MLDILSVYTDAWKLNVNTDKKWNVIFRKGGNLNVTKNGSIRTQYWKKKTRFVIWVLFLFIIRNLQKLLNTFTIKAVKPCLPCTLHVKARQFWSCTAYMVCLIHISFGFDVMPLTYGGGGLIMYWNWRLHLEFYKKVLQVKILLL